MTSSKPKPKEVCRNFAKGDCKYGDRCFNIHERTSVPSAPYSKQRVEKKQQPSQQRTEPPPPMYNNGVKKAGPTYISSRHREYIGQGAHEPTPANQFGLSRNQRVVLSALVAHDNEHTDSWINGSVFNHVSRDSNGNTFAGVLTTSSTSPLPDDTAVPDDIVPSAVTLCACPICCTRISCRNSVPYDTTSYVSIFSILSIIICD